MPASPQSPAARLAWFVAGLFVLLLAFEVFERRHHEAVVAASHRGLTKVAMLAQHPRVEVLFLGSSRMQDGVSPDLVTRGLKVVAPQLGDVQGFNAAFTGSSLPALMAFVPLVDGRADLRVVVIELSEPQTSNEPVPWVEPVPVSATLEDRLGDVAERVHFIRYRKALLSGNLGRVPSLAFGSRLGGWETKGSEQAAAIFGYRESPASGFDPSRWRPEVISGSPSPQRLDARGEVVADQLASIAQRLRATGVTTVFAVPPMAAYDRLAPERNGMRPLFAEVARRCGCEVWNFATVELPDSYFRDMTHVNREGRAHYSEALARELPRVLAAR